MNSLPGPDKGLLDVLFGSKAPEAQAAQAKLPGEQVMSVEDFMTALAKAQDQTAAVASGPQPKEGMPETPKSSIPAQPAQAQVQAQPQAAMPKADPKLAAKQELPVKSKQPEQKEAKVVEKEEKPVKPAVAQAPSAQAQMAAAMAAVQHQQQQQQVAGKPESAVGDSQKGAKKPTVQGAPGPKAPVAKQIQTHNQPQAQVQHELEMAALQNPTAAKAQANASADRTKQPLHAATAGDGAAPTTTVVQPIVIQMPMAMPMAMAMPMPMAFDVVEASEDPSAEIGRGSKSIVSSQDFLASRGTVLGVDRPDPRLVTRVKEDRSNQEEAGNSGMNGRSDFALLMPHVLSTPGKGVGGDEARISASAGPQQMTSIHSSQLEASNPMALASSVQGLMARGGGSVKVRLAPEGLGDMTISVQQGRNRQLDVKFEAGSQEAREALLGSVPQLRETLSSSRYEVGSIEVARPSAETALGGISLGNSQLGLNNQMGLMTNDRTFSDHSNQNQSQQHDSGSAWDRYNDQQEKGQHSGGRGRDQQSAYRRYQEYAFGA